MPQLWLALKRLERCDCEAAEFKMPHASVRSNSPDIEAIGFASP
jgi:hypothetical protein